MSGEEIAGGREKTVLVYLRLHKRLDDSLTRFGEQTGMPRASALRWILERWIASVPSGEEGEAALEKGLPLSRIGEDYILARGRTEEGSLLGRGIRLTMKQSTERRLNLIAWRAGIRPSELRTLILADYLQIVGLL